MAITLLPTPPSRQDPINFNVRADEFLGALPAFGAEANSLATDVNSKQTTASNAATTATAAASTATTKAGEAEDSADAAEFSAQAANTAKLAAEAALDSFDDRYLGAKATGPATDNDGNPLIIGALYFRTGVGMQVWNGTAWVASYLTLEDVLDKTGGKLTGALDWATPVGVASAATTNIGAAASNRVRITGTTTITSLGTIAAGASRTVTFSGALTLTHNAASLILPGGANIVTAAGDVAEFESLGSGNWRCTGYMRSSGQAVSVSPLPNTITKTVANPGASSFTAWTGNHYLIWSVLTATLPASPMVGDTIYFTSWLPGWTIARNGNVISGVAEDLVVDIGGPGKAMKTFGLRFIDAGASVGWVILL